MFRLALICAVLLLLCHEISPQKTSTSKTTTSSSKTTAKPKNTAKPGPKTSTKKVSKTTVIPVSKKTAKPGAKTTAKPKPTTTPKPGSKEMPIAYTKPGELNLKKNNLLKTLETLEKEWEISFEFKPTSYNHSGFTSLLTLTKGGHNKKYGDRTPAILFHARKGMHVASAINNSVDIHKDVKPAPKVGKWSTIVVSQLKSTGSKYILKVKVDGKEVWKVDNSKAEKFSKVKVFASDPWHETQPGAIRELTIKTK